MIKKVWRPLLQGLDFNFLFELQSFVHNWLCIAEFLNGQSSKYVAEMHPYFDKKKLEMYMYFIILTWNGPNESHGQVCSFLLRWCTGIRWNCRWQFVTQCKAVEAGAYPETASFGPASHFYSCAGKQGQPLRPFCRAGFRIPPLYVASGLVLNWHLAYQWGQEQPIQLKNITGHFWKPKYDLTK